MLTLTLDVSQKCQTRPECGYILFPLLRRSLRVVLLVLKVGGGPRGMAF